MEADLVGLGRPVAVALARAHVHEHRRFLLLEGLADDGVEGHQVVPGHGTHVGHAQVLEQAARLAEIDDRVAEPPGPLQ